MSKAPGISLRLLKPRPPRYSIRACFANVYATPVPIHVRRYSSKPGAEPEKPKETKTASVDAISNVLQETDASRNNLLAPVHIPEDPHAVLNEKHPAASILANSAIVITRQFEMMNMMLGFEQANKYVIMDPQGQHIGFMAERDLGTGGVIKRQMFSTHRSFTTHVFDRSGKEVLRFHRPFSVISSRIGIYDPLSPDDRGPSDPTAISPIVPRGLSTDINQDAVRISQLELADMRQIGEAQQQWAPLRRKYNLFLHRDMAADSSAPQLTAGDLPLTNSTDLQPASDQTPNSGGHFGQFAYVDEQMLSWDFSVMTSDNQLLGSVNRNFSGFGREIFTDTGVYALRMDSAGLAQAENKADASDALTMPIGPGMTLDQRAIMLATAVSIDFDYFSRSSRGLGGMWPLWLPGFGGGGGAAGAEAGAEAGAGAGALEGGVMKDGLEKVPGSVMTGEGAMAGAGTMAGYEAMQRGAYGGDDASPQQGQPAEYTDGSGYAPDAPSTRPGEVGYGEDIWGGGGGGGGGQDPWGSGGGGADDLQDPWAGDGGQGGGGDGGGEGGWWDTLTQFFED